MARYDDLNTKTIGYLTFVSAILLAVTILLLQALCFNWIEWQDETKLLKQSYNSSDELIAAQKQSLSGYSKVQVEVPIEPVAADGQATKTDGQTTPPASADAGGTKQPVPQTKTVERVHIPIERAKSLLLDELKSAPAAATTPNT